MSDANNMSDLAKAVLAGERITSSTGIDKSPAVQVTGIKSVPKGAVPITEGAISLNFSKEEKNPSNENE